MLFGERRPLHHPVHIMAPDFGSVIISLLPASAVRKVLLEILKQDGGTGRV